MKNIVSFVISILLIGCASAGFLNKTIYQKADRIVYVKIFGDQTEITDKNVILDIADILGEAKKEPVQFVTNEQLIFFRGKDTLTIMKNGTSLMDDKGTYTLTTEAEKKLVGLLKK